ncbi:hypothetical protein SCATT_24300 [Streptantibioticus cattleyicolor NRRL 8057 = DSM 46488]|uniref:Uncharacterized protein n=1 Tax=Streptantibioticus cattleyicolor (strain ATCC 35852 / DSM 46488 / JCM 4925 / NBRC 14057 / NRRL 8057) TaxID=1003195 RepID=G8WS41_STREN|nr:hypothetical protein SCATT_24300 [Streptantibioticus cattleyicolor NRRL 8057 = DSM 46488]
MKWSSRTSGVPRAPWCPGADCSGPRWRPRRTIRPSAGSFPTAVRTSPTRSFCHSQRQSANAND